MPLPSFFRLASAWPGSDQPGQGFEPQKPELDIRVGSSAFASFPILDKTEALKKYKTGVYSDDSDLPSETRREEDRRLAYQKVKVHKLRPQRPETLEDYNDMIDSKIAEIVPGVADLSLSEAAFTADTRKVASDIRQRFNKNLNPDIQAVQREKNNQLLDEVAELRDIYDMSKSHPLDTAFPSSWNQQLRPTPRQVQLSWYQQNMVQYIRFLQGRNIWYYRDRMNIPRGPCPAHVLRECWVHGVIDENTLIWGQGLFDWIPVKNVKCLVPQIRTFEVRLGAWIKKNFSLKPNLNRIRKERAEYRDSELQTQQVARMR